MPAYVDFQFPKLVQAPPIGEGWLHEIKFDGYRIQVRVERGKARVHTRNLIDWTDQLASLAAAAGALPDCLIDGELCALGNDGYSSFSRLRSALAKKLTDGLVMFVFDILFEGVEDLRPYALTVRKRRLAAVLKAGGKATAGTLLPVDEFPGDPKDMFGAACRLGFEGMVSKRRDAPYRTGTAATWLKAKCRPTAEVVIGGWRTDGARFRSLIAGIWHDGRLHYAGAISTGYSDADVRELATLLAPLEVDGSPFEAGQVPKKTRDIHWARPTLVAEIAFAELTAAGKLRQASFKRLRLDRTPEDLRSEEQTG